MTKGVGGHDTFATVTLATTAASLQVRGNTIQHAVSTSTMTTLCYVVATIYYWTTFITILGSRL